MLQCSTFIEGSLTWPTGEVSHIMQALAGPGSGHGPAQNLTIGRPKPARPPTPHFSWQGPGQHGPQPLTSIGQAGRPNSLLLANPALLLARPLTSASQANPGCVTVSTLQWNIIDWLSEAEVERIFLARSNDLP